MVETIIMKKEQKRMMNEINEKNERKTFYNN